MEIKESYKERLSESGDNSGLIVVISANWMTLGFANAKRNVQAPARDPSENSALAAHNFAEPFPYEAPRGAGAGVGWAPLLLKRDGGTVGSVAWPPLAGPCPVPGLSLGPTWGSVDVSAPTPVSAPHSFHLMPPYSCHGFRPQPQRGPGGTPCSPRDSQLPPSPTRAPPRRVFELSELSRLPSPTP